MLRDVKSDVLDSGAGYGSCVGISNIPFVLNSIIYGG